MNSTTGKIYLIPTPLSETNVAFFDISYNNSIIERLRIFVVEELRTARRFLRKVDSDFPIDDCQFHILNEHTITTINLDEIIQEVLNGKDIGIMSEAGLPCIADPGSELVALAHRKNIQVIPLVGASSIFMALMASGLCGQKFAFHGYLPTDKTDLTNVIRKLEQQSRTEKQTQIFMETPYRNMQLLELLLKHCHGETLLCVACNITSNDEYIQTKSISQWKKSKLPALHKRPTVFVLSAN
jgi:16S rRNA (cytidine1402-2'-O)-methyltransferase